MFALCLYEDWFWLLWVSFWSCVSVKALWMLIKPGTELFILLHRRWLGLLNMPWILLRTWSNRNHSTFFPLGWAVVHEKVENDTLVFIVTNLITNQQRIDWALITDQRYTRLLQYTFICCSRCGDALLLISATVSCYTRSSKEIPEYQECTPAWPSPPSPFTVSLCLSLFLFLTLPNYLALSHTSDIT